MPGDCPLELGAGLRLEPGLENGRGGSPVTRAPPDHELILEEAADALDA
jgi:hypothetical protein